MTHPPLSGLVAATHTPFTAAGDLNLAIVERQAAHLLEHGIPVAFIGGTTGESHSLTLAERSALTTRWLQVTDGTDLEVIVHVGSNCLPDACTLAAQADQLGARGIAALAPSYFKPKDVRALVDCCAELAAAAPETPFYYYDIPKLSGVELSMPEFAAQAAERVPTFAGIKWTNPDLYAWQLVRHSGLGLDLPWGCDEFLLAALAIGATGAVGSTYNFAAPVYQRLLAAFAAGDLAAARVEQYRSAQLVKLLAGYGFMGAAKATMTLLGVDVGPARLPNAAFPLDKLPQLRAELEALGFFDWIRP